MGTVFTFLIGASITASILMIAVILLRLPLKKVSKNVTLLLWAVVALRLMLPFSVQTDKSVIPNRAEITRGVESALSGTVDTRVYEPVRQSAAQTQTGVPVSPPAQQGEGAAEAEQKPASSPLAAADIAGMIWAAGAGAFAVFALASYLRLRRTVKASIE
ncbi:MAG: hypothetical protein IK047_03355, partial [Clostridia bacterium]|nr:hypothetical protein [Clostridia bacterium]